MNYWFSGMPWHATWYHWQIHYGDTRLVIFVALGLACVVAFWRLGHYARRRPFWQELGDVLGVVVTLAILDAALVFLTKTNFSRLWWATSWALVALLVPLARLAIKHVADGARRLARGRPWWSGPGPTRSTPRSRSTASPCSASRWWRSSRRPRAAPGPRRAGLSRGRRQAPAGAARGALSRPPAGPSRPAACGGRARDGRARADAAPMSSASICTTATSTSSRRCAACRSPARR